MLLINLKNIYMIYLLWKIKKFEKNAQNRQIFEGSSKLTDGRTTLNYSSEPHKRGKKLHIRFDFAHLKFLKVEN